MDGMLLDGKTLHQSGKAVQCKVFPKHTSGLAAEVSDLESTN